MTSNSHPEQIAVLESLLDNRYSCRAFLPDSVPRATIEHLLKIAQRTASWCNSQPWQIIIASGDETRRFRDVMLKAAEHSPPTPDVPWPREYTGRRLERRRESGFQLYNSLGIARGDKAAYARQTLENYNFFGAPHVAIITAAEELGVYGAVDCGLYIGNFLLAAQALGLAAIPQAALAGHAAAVHDYFKLGAELQVVCGVSFGYPDRQHPANSFRTSRAKIDEAVRFVGD